MTNQDKHIKKIAALSNFLNNTDFGYQLGSVGKYTVPTGLAATLLSSYLNWSNAKDTEVEGETEDERRRRLWRAAINPAILGTLATGAGTLGLGALNTSDNSLSKDSVHGFKDLFLAGLKGKSDSKTSDIKYEAPTSTLREYFDYLKYKVPVGAAIVRGPLTGALAAAKEAPVGKILLTFGGKVVENIGDDLNKVLWKAPIGIGKGLGKGLWQIGRHPKNTWSKIKNVGSPRNFKPNVKASKDAIAKALKTFKNTGSFKRLGLAGKAGITTGALSLLLDQVIGD
jgi:hypothetical protein